MVYVIIVLQLVDSYEPILRYLCFFFDFLLASFRFLGYLPCLSKIELMTMCKGFGFLGLNFELVLDYLEMFLIKSNCAELEGDADDEEVKLAYGRLVKSYLLDAYNGTWSLEEGETAEARFIKIQAAYELLIDSEQRRKYVMENRFNPMKASQSWMEWLTRRRKAFDQQGDMAIAAWAEQENRELNARVRSLSHSKVYYYKNNLIS
ncbi:hypothetical protein L1987_07611 [Smallanthus sonchifolius]|uniref:Uncharacterized protein n=1 Tax=Smallanthus sonchifolius TaxID=185202 RepID=A0ACB9K0W5_9ASTR|nr:hypothetical protein L1987_07611 [Smallanthus sonchifolius]